jgi:cation transport ATPase
MKYCTKCGTMLRDKDLFCSNCGNKVSAPLQANNSAKVEENNEKVVVETTPTLKEEIIKEDNNQNFSNEITNETDIKEQKEEINSNVGKKIKKRVSIHEQPIKEFLTIALAIIGCSMIFWMVDQLAPLDPTAITRIFPYLLFLFITIFNAVMSMIRAVKTLKRKIYLKSVLSFVLFGLLVTCALIDFIFLVNS